MLGIIFDIMFFLNLKLFLKHRFYLIIGTKNRIKMLLHFPKRIEFKLELSNMLFILKIK
jgi:hypothetical protein